MNIVLINPTLPPPRTIKVTQNRGHVSVAKEYMYPYSLVFLTSYLMKSGYSAKIIDLNMTTETEMYKFLVDVKPKIVGVTGVTENRFHVVDLIKKIRWLLKDSFIVVGGRHFSYTSEQACEAVPEIDIVVRGEGEITFLEVVKSLEEKEPLNTILGITYKDAGGIYVNADRPSEMDMDSLAIDRRFLPEGGYSDLLIMRNYEKEGIKSIPMQLGRGCTHNCVFCIHRFMKYRMRSLRSVMEEIEYCIKRYDCKYFSFNDPSIYCDPSWMYSFCDELLRKEMNIKWYCEGRVDVPLDLLRLMARAGCKSLDVGIESASSKILKSMMKKIEPSMFLPYAKLTRELGIRSKMFYMISLPDENENDALVTLNMAKKLGKYTYRVGCGFTEIFPGTVLENIAKKKGLFPEDFDWYDRSYDNHLPVSLGLRSSSPVYLEHLKVDFIEKMLRRYNYLNLRMAINNQDFVRLVRGVFNKRSSTKDFIRRGLGILKGAI